MKISRLFSAIMLCLFNNGTRADAQECSMVQAIIKDNYPYGAKRFYLCDKPQEQLKRIQTDFVQMALKEVKFSATETDEILHFVMRANLDIVKVKCNDGPIVHLSQREAEKLFDKVEKKGDGYRLRHETYDFTVYFMSAPVYYKDYAFMLAYNQCFKSYTYYKIYMFKKENEEWKKLTCIDIGMYIWGKF